MNTSPISLVILKPLDRRKEPMITSLRILALSIISLSLVGCAGTMAPIVNFDDEPTHRELTLEQTTKGIKLGADAAGWLVEPISENQMRATKYTRSHTVIVMIDYTADSYSINYDSSYHMKVKCEAQLDPKKSYMVTNGASPCPGGAPPTFIHKNYNAWVQQLNHAISAGLSAF